MKHYSLPCLLAMLTFAIVSCTEMSPTGPEADGQAGVGLSKHKPGHGGGPGGGGDDDFTNWAFTAVKGSDIKLLSFDGRTTSMLVGGGNTNRYSPRFTADGSEVAFLSDPNELRIVGIDGSNGRLLYQFAPGDGPHYARFDWIPETEKIIYRAYLDLAVLDTQSGQLQMLDWPSLFPGDGLPREVSAGPDLDSLTLGFQGPIVAGWLSYDTGESDLYVVMAIEDGSGTFTLDPTKLARLELPDTPGEGAQNHPVFSPDGSKIAFQDNVSCCHGQELWVVGFDLASWSFDLMQDPPVLLASTAMTSSLNFISYQPTWAPDASWIAFTGVYEGNGPNGGGRLTRVQPDGSSTTALSSKVPSFHPDWSPVWCNDIDNPGGC